MFRQNCFRAWVAFLLIAPTSSAQETPEIPSVPFASVGISDSRFSATCPFSWRPQSFATACFLGYQTTTRGLIWSITYPGQAPCVSLVDGQGFTHSDSRRADYERWPCALVCRFGRNR